MKKLNLKAIKEDRLMDEAISSAELAGAKVEDFSTIRVTADIDADGDVFILAGSKFRYIGKLGESTFSQVPDPQYLKIKKWLKKYEQPKQ